MGIFINNKDGKRLIRRSGAGGIYTKYSAESSPGNIVPFNFTIQGDPHFKIYNITSTGAQNYLAQWDDNAGADNSEVLLVYIKTDATETSVYYTKQIIPRYSPAKTTKSIKTVVNGVTTNYSLASAPLNINLGPISVGPLILYITKRQDVSGFGTHSYFDWTIKSSRTISNVSKFGGGIPLAIKKAIALNSSILSAQVVTSVDPRSDWQAGPTLVAGQSYVISATGTVQWGLGSSGPDGVVHPYSRVDDRFLHEALLGRIGANGSIFLIGSGLTYTATSSGVLYLATNDTNRIDNSGSFSVNITDAAVSWIGSDGPTVDGFSEAGADFDITLSDLETAASSGIGTAAWDKVSFDGSSFSGLGVLLSDSLSPTARTTFNWDPLPYIESDPLLSEPTSLSGTAYDSVVALSWTAPTNYGPSITDYLIEYSGDGGTNWTTFSHSASSSTSITVTGLSNNTSYVFKVSAINSTGTGPASDNSSSLTPLPASPPSQPTNITGSIGVDYVVVSWNAPASINGALITDYVVQYSSDSGSSWTTFNDGTSTSTTATVTGLVSGSSYIFRVAATNSAGTGSYSSNSGSFAIPTAGIIFSTNSTPRALVGGGVSYSPTFINADYREYFNSVVNPDNFSVLNGTLPLQNLLSDSYSYSTRADWGYGSLPSFSFNFRIPTVITKYRMWNGFLANYGITGKYGDIGNQTPQAWTLQGSNDDISWTTVDSRSGQSRLDYATSVDPASSPYSEYSITSPTAYKSYKLVVSTGGRSGYDCGKSGCAYDTQIGEVQLWGYESPTTPCALHGYNTLLPTAKYYNSSGVVSNDSFANVFNMSTILGLPNQLKWMNYPNPWQLSTGSTKDGYFGFDYPITLTAYKIWSGSASAYSFNLYGANTFGSWTLIDNKTLATVGANVTFNVASPASYSYYKLSFTNSNYTYSTKESAGYYVSINDIQLQGYLT